MVHRYLLENCNADLQFINKMVDKTAIARLEQVASTPFKRVSYTEAIELLQDVVARGVKNFEYKVSVQGLKRKVVVLTGYIHRPI